MRTWGPRPVPNPPVFSQGLRVLRSPWDPAPSPRLHAPRKIGSAGACLFAVAAALACDYSCSAAGRCGALCLRQAPPWCWHPTFVPGGPGCSTTPNIPGHRSQGTSALDPRAQGSVAGMEGFFWGSPTKPGNEHVLVAGSRDQAGLTAQLGPDPNTSGKFPVCSVAAWCSHALRCQPGSASLHPTCRELTLATAQPAPAWGS